jgi:hypothetical protein
MPETTKARPTTAREQRRLYRQLREMADQQQRRREEMIERRVQEQRERPHHQHRPPADR